MPRLVVPVVLLLALTSCAGITNRVNGWLQPQPSNVSDVAVAANLTGLTAEALPPANTIVSVHKSGGFGGKKLTQIFIAELRDRGFGISDHGGVPVNYSASQFSSAILLWVHTESYVVVRAYQPQPDGSLIPVSPLSLGELN